MNVIKLSQSSLYRTYIHITLSGDRWLLVSLFYLTYYSWEPGVKSPDRVIFWPIFKVYWHEHDRQNKTKTIHCSFGVGVQAKLIHVQWIHWYHVSYFIMYQSFVFPAPTGPGSSGAFNFSVCPAKCPALRGKFMVKFLLIAPPTRTLG